MKIFKIMAILGLLSLTQAYGMEQPPRPPRPPRPGVNPEQQSMVEELQRLQGRKKPAAAADGTGATYHKPLPTPPAKKPAAVVAPVIAAKPAAAPMISAKNQELIDELAKKLTKLSEKVNSLNDKIPTVVSTLKSGDVSQYIDPKFIKTGFFTVVRGGEAALLISKIKSLIQDLNQTDAETKQAAKERLTPILTSAAFSTATKNIEDNLDKLPEPFGSEAKKLINIADFLRAQFGIKATAAQGSQEAQEAR